jgi:hypothetical protein
LLWHKRPLFLLVLEVVWRTEGMLSTSPIE